MSPLSSCWRTRSENDESGMELADVLSNGCVLFDAPEVCNG